MDFVFLKIDYRDNSAEGLEMTFSTDDVRFGEVVTVDLKPGGRDIPVTDENKEEYIQYFKDSP